MHAEVLQNVRVLLGDGGGQTCMTRKVQEFLHNEILKCYQSTS